MNVDENDKYVLLTYKEVHNDKIFSLTSRPAFAHIEHILHSMHCHFNCLTAAASSGENFRQLG